MTTISYLQAPQRKRDGENKHLTASKSKLIIPALGECRLAVERCGKVNHSLQPPPPPRPRAVTVTWKYY